MLRARTLATTALLTIGVSVAGLVATTGPAAAHVTVNPQEAEQGGYTRVAFRVPTESDTASTTKVEIFLPESSPIPSVSTMPVPGWTVRVERAAPKKPVTAHGQQLTEVVSKITWTAGAGAGVKPGEFQEFPVSLGPLPEVDRLVFKALQTYSDGTVVRWIEEPVDGQEQESPAPVLALAPAAEEGESAAGSGGTAAGAKASDDSADGSDSGPALVVAIVALVVALLAAALATFTTLTRPRP